jgi:hypothetical protein
MSARGATVGAGSKVGISGGLEGGISSTFASKTTVGGLVARFAEDLRAKRGAWTTHVIAATAKAAVTAETAAIECHLRLAPGVCTPGGPESSGSKVSAIAAADAPTSWGREVVPLRARTASEKPVGRIGIGRAGVRRNTEVHEGQDALSSTSRSSFIDAYRS